MVLQTPRPFETMTVRENATLGAMFGGPECQRARRDRRRRRDARFVELPTDATKRSARTSTSSGSSDRPPARGLPRLVLLDEVMAGLNDSELGGPVEMVRRARAEFGVTVIWVEHVMKAVMSLAERILVLNFGELIADGEPSRSCAFPDVVTAYLDRRPGGGRDTTSQRPMLGVRGVSAGYAGEDVIHDISFDVAEGEAITIIGSNGAGKSTLFRAIISMLEVTSGRCTSTARH